MRDALRAGAYTAAKLMRQRRSTLRALSRGETTKPRCPLERKTEKKLASPN
jgi:hypothetical protein